MKIESGEIITLDNNREYICFSSLDYQGQTYLYLISNFKPIDIKFAKQLTTGDNVQIEVINNQDEKMKLLQLFQSLAN